MRSRVIIAAQIKQRQGRSERENIEITTAIAYISWNDNLNTLTKKQIPQAAIQWHKGITAHITAGITLTFSKLQVVLPGDWNLHKIILTLSEELKRHLRCWKKNKNKIKTQKAKKRKAKM